MASPLALMGYGVMERSNATPASAFGMMLADGAVSFLGGVGLGEVYGRYSDLPGWKGKLAKYSPELTGGVGKVAEAVAMLFLGPGMTSGVMGALGNMGLGVSGTLIGLDHVRKVKGVEVVQVPAGTAKGKLKQSPAATAVGGVPGGRGLAWEHIKELQNSH